METTTTSFGRLISASSSTIEPTVAPEREDRRLIPALPGSAAQWRGTPLVSDAHATTMTRPSFGISTIAGALASARLWPAPAVLMRNLSKAFNVSMRAAGPQSRTWLLARTQQSTGRAQRGAVLGAHAVIDALWLESVAAGDARFEINDSHMRMRPPPPSPRRARDASICHRNSPPARVDHDLGQPNSFIRSLTCGYSSSKPFGRSRPG